MFVLGLQMVDETLNLKACISFYKWRFNDNNCYRKKRAHWKYVFYSTEDIYKYLLVIELVLKTIYKIYIFIYNSNHSAQKISD